MGDSLTLDDGRALVRSSIGVSGALSLIAQQMTDEFAELKVWLLDVSDRPNGFASVDLRGLSAAHRTHFHAAARAACCELSADASVAGSGSPTYHVLTDLVRMLDSMDRGEPPDTPPTDIVRDNVPEPADLNQIWSTE